MVQDIDIKSKRILLSDFDGTLIETASGNTFATDLTDMPKEHASEGIVILNNDHIYILENPYGVGLNIKITLKDFYKIETDDGKTATVDDALNIRIDKDQNFNSYSDVVKIETLKDGSIKYTSLYHESKENSDSLS